MEITIGDHSKTRYLILPLAIEIKTSDHIREIEGGTGCELKERSAEYSTVMKNGEFTLIAFADFSKVFNTVRLIIPSSSVSSMQLDCLRLPCYGS